MYVTHMRGLYTCAIWQVNRQGVHCNASVGNISTLHYENGGGASVRNCPIWRNRNSIDTVWGWLESTWCCIVEYAAAGIDTMLKLFDVTIVTSSSARADLLVMARVGFGYCLYAETKLLHLCANLIVSAPNSQVACLAGSTLLCIPLVHGLYPAAMNC